VARAKIGFRFFMFAMYLNTTIILLLPHFSSVPIIPAFWIQNIVGVVIMLSLLMYYGLQVRTLLNSMEVSKTFYARLRKKLDIFLIAVTVLFTSAVIAMILMINISVFSTNQYILSFMLIFAAQVVSSFTLMSISGSKEDVASVHHLDTDKKKQSQQGSFDITVGSRSQRSGPSSVVETPVQHYASRLHDHDMDSSTKPLTASPSIALTILPSSSTHGLPEQPEQQQPEIRMSQTLRSYQRGIARLEEMEWGNDPEREMSVTREQAHTIVMPSELVASPTEEQLLALSPPSSSPSSPTTGDKDDWNVQ